MSGSVLENVSVMEPVEPLNFAAERCHAQATY